MGRGVSEGSTILGVTITKSSLSCCRSSVERKSAPRIGMSPNRGSFRTLSWIDRSSRPAIARLLTLAQLDLRLGAPGEDRRHLEPGDRQSAGEVERRHLRRDVQADVADVGHRRREVQANPELPPLDAHGVARLRTLYGGERKLTAREEGGLLPVQGEQRRLGPDS